MNIIYLNLYYICYNIQKKFLIFGIKTIIYSIKCEKSTFFFIYIKLKILIRYQKIKKMFLLYIFYHILEKKYHN